MTRKLSQAELAAWQAFLHAHQQVIDKLDAELRAEHQLTLSDYDVLLRLARAPEGKLGMTELAKRIMFSPSGLTRVIDRLVRDGFVERLRDTADARVVFARLTENGRDTVRNAAKTHLRGIREHFAARLGQRHLRNVAAALELIAGPHQPH